VYCLVRTLFFARFVETPEPRYVLECFPAVIALGAQVLALRESDGFPPLSRCDGAPRD
jgi:hypothetical protein